MSKHAFAHGLLNEATKRQDARLDAVEPGVFEPLEPVFCRLADDEGFVELRLKPGPVSVPTPGTLRNERRAMRKSWKRESGQKRKAEIGPRTTDY